MLEQEIPEHLRVPTRPTPKTVQLDNIPEVLRNIPRWVTWQYVLKDGEWTKPPHFPDGTPGASHSKSETWGSFDQCVETYKSGNVDGIGIILYRNPINEDGDFLVGVDLDNKDKSINTPEKNTEIEEFHQKIITLFDSYTERSPSGKGYRIFVIGKLPDRGRKNPKTSIEIYDHQRFLTVTGDSI